MEFRWNSGDTTIPGTQYLIQVPSPFPALAAKLALAAYHAAWELTGETCMVALARDAHRLCEWPGPIVSRKDAKRLVDSTGRRPFLLRMRAGQIPRWKIPLRGRPGPDSFASLRLRVKPNSTYPPSRVAPVIPF
jgi:hypothetical protein